jgi:hypothetical protein
MPAAGRKPSSWHPFGTRYVASAASSGVTGTHCLPYCTLGARRTAAVSQQAGGAARAAPQLSGGEGTRGAEGVCCWCGRRRAHPEPSDSLRLGHWVLPLGVILAVVLPVGEQPPPGGTARRRLCRRLPGAGLLHFRHLGACRRRRRRRRHIRQHPSQIGRGLLRRRLGRRRRRPQRRLLAHRRCPLLARLVAQLHLQGGRHGSPR